MIGGLNEAFLDSRKCQETSTLLALSIMLESGAAIDRALFSACQSSVWQPYRAALADICRQLAEGIPLQQAVESRPATALPEKIRYILGSNLYNDREKGSLIAASLKEVEGKNASAFVTLWSGFAFFFILQMSVFVIPQFVEILHGVDVELSLFLRMMIAISGKELVIFVPCMVLSLYRFFTRQRKSVRLQNEILFLLNFLGRVENVGVRSAIERVANPVLMPNTCKAFESIISGECDSKEIFQRVLVASNDRLVSWSFTVGLAGADCSEVFARVSKYASTSFGERTSRASIIAGNLAVLVIGGFIGSVTIGLFMTMAALVQATL